MHLIVKVSYLVKYVSGKEEHQRVRVVPSKLITEVNVETADHAHEKITGAKRIADNKEARNPTQGREVALTEVLWFILGCHYTYTNAQFVHVSTKPLENRIGLLKNRTAIEADSSDDLGPVLCRRRAGLDEWRQFTDSQQALIDDYCRSPYWVDSTSSFNIRPPELLFFNDLQTYCECFVSVGKEKCSYDVDVAMQKWFDGLSRRIMLRSSSIDKAVQFVVERSSQGCNEADVMLQSVFRPIRREDEGFWNRYVKATPADQTVSVISFVKPWERAQFVYHLCLSLGRYDTEMDVFSRGSLREAFFRRRFTTFGNGHHSAIAFVDTETIHRCRSSISSDFCKKVFGIRPCCVRNAQ